MTNKKQNRSKVPNVKVKRTLNKLTSKVLFPEKLEEANNVLKTVGLPRKKAH